MIDRAKFQESILNTISLALIATDIKGKIIYLNLAAEKFVSFSATDVVGKPLKNYLRIADILSGKEYDDIVQQVIKHGTANWQGAGVKLIAGNKSEYFINGSANPMFDSKGLVEGVFISFRNIKESAEQNGLQEFEGFSFAAINALSAHICVLDEFGDIIWVNQAWRDFAIANSSLNTEHYLGVNYLLVCNEAKGDDA